MRIEDYKNYMERVETTTEMDERVLKNLKNSMDGKGISNRNFLQQILKHTGTFIYRASIAAVCVLVILVIGKSYVRTDLSGDNSNAQKNMPSDNSNAQKDASSDSTSTTYLRTPHFSNLYGQEIGSYATK